MKGMGKWATSWCLVATLFSTSLSQKETGDIELGCPIRSYKFKDYCYGLEYVKTHYDLAEIMCERMDGILAPIKDEETFYFLQKLRIKSYFIDYWFNLNDRYEEGNWVHGDNTTTTFSKWAPHEPNNYNKNQHCAMEWVIKDFMWDDDQCFKQHYYICEYPVSKCGSNSYIFGGLCYELSTEFATFDTALTKCQEKGGTLTNDRTEEIHRFLKTLIYAERRWMDMTTEVAEKIIQDYGSKIPVDWFGLRGFEDEWVFSDGTPLRRLSFAKWNRYGGPNKNRCASLGRTWIDEHCEIHRSFICRYKVSKNSTFPAQVGYVLKQVELYTGIRITSTKLGFALFGCIILGMILVVLLIVAGKLTRRVEVIVRPSVSNDEHRMNILNNE